MLAIMILKHYFPIICPSAYLSVFDSFLLEMFLQFFFSEILHNVSGTYKMQQSPSCEENSPWKSGSSIFLIIFAGRERIMTETSCFSEIRNSIWQKSSLYNFFCQCFVFLIFTMKVEYTLFYISINSINIPRLKKP